MKSKKIQDLLLNLKVRHVLVLSFSVYGIFGCEVRQHKCLAWETYLTNNRNSTLTPARLAMIFMRKENYWIEIKKRKDLMSNGASGYDVSAKVFTRHPVKCSIGDAKI